MPSPHKGIDISTSTNLKTWTNSFIDTLISLYWYGLWQIMLFTRYLLKISIIIFTVTLGLVIYQGSRSSSLFGGQSESPYFGRWKTWFSLSQSIVTDSKQSLGKGWNVIHHLGGNGPWIENTGEGAASNLNPPEGCSVDQVHLVCSLAISYYAFANEI